jgi:hypothetical protein
MRLPGSVRSFAGFQAPACVTIAEAMLVSGVNSDAALDAAMSIH